jgi:thioredoxin 1
MELEITNENFDSLLGGDKPLMVDFYADWCGPCRHIMPFVEQIAEEYAGRAVVGRCNVDDCGEIAERYGIMSIPAVLYFKNGELANTIVGGVPKAQLEDALKAIL